jgi:hypothetical protein
MVFCETPVVSAALLTVVSPLHKYIRYTNLASGSRDLSKNEPALIIEKQIIDHY